MSKGLGRIQAAICEGLAGGERFRGQLCWEIAEREDGLNQEGIKPQFYNAFSRALSTLTRAPRNKVRVDQRKLVSFDEVIALYPYKTRALQVRDLRIQLLPLLRNMADEDPLLGEHKFTDLGQEDYIVKRLRQSELVAFSAAQGRWRELQGQLFAAAPLLTDPRSRLTWLRLLARGWEILEEKSSVFAKGLGLHVDDTIEAILRECETMPEASLQSVSATIYGARQIFDELIDGSRRAHTQLKNLLFDAVDFSQRGRSHLKPGAKQHLFSRAPDVLEALPGHEPGVPPQVRRRSLFGPPSRPYPAQFSPALDQLIDRHCLEKFEFLSLVRG